MIRDPEQRGNDRALPAEEDIDEHLALFETEFPDPVDLFESAIAEGLGNHHRLCPSKGALES